LRNNAWYVKVIDLSDTTLCWQPQGLVYIAPK
jgi:hypothetical protein